MHVAVYRKNISYIKTDDGQLFFRGLPVDEWPLFWTSHSFSAHRIVKRTNSCAAGHLICGYCSCDSTAPDFIHTVSCLTRRNTRRKAASETTPPHCACTPPADGRVLTAEDAQHSRRAAAAALCRK